MSGCSFAINATAQASASFEGPNLAASAAGNGQISANWTVNDDNCEWDFEKAVGSWGLSGSFDWKNGLLTVLRAIPPAAPVATALSTAISFINRWTPLQIENGINVGIGIQFSGLEWNSQPPFPDFLLPDVIHEAELTAQMGPYIKITQRGVDNVEMRLSGFIKGVLTLLPSVSLKELTGNLALDARYRWFTFNRTVSFGYVASELGLEELLAADLTSSELPGGLTMHFDPGAAMGTGNVYDGSALLAGVGADLYEDSAVSLARDSNGVEFGVWSKEVAHDSAQMGEIIHVADWSGTAWSAPVALAGSLGLNSDVQAIGYGEGRRLVVFAHADSAALGASTTPDQLDAARDAADLYYATFDGTSWSAPQLLRSTMGLDGDIALSTTASGEVRAAWMIRDAGGMFHLVSEVWDGSGWTGFAEITSGTLADVEVAEVAGSSTLIWTQDTGSGSELFTSRFSGGTCPLEHSSCPRPHPPRRRRMPGTDSGVVLPPGGAGRLLRRGRRVRADPGVRARSERHHRPGRIRAGELRPRRGAAALHGALRERIRCDGAGETGGDHADARRGPRPAHFPVRRFRLGRPALRGR